MSRSLPYLPRYQSLSPARSPCLGGRRFASLRSVSSPSNRQRICYIDGGEPTKLVSTSYRGRGSPSPKRSYKVHLFGPAFSPDGKKRVHHATRVTRSISAHDLQASHVYTSQDDLLPGTALQAEARRACTSLHDLFHKGPFYPDATATSESGVSLGGLSDESLSLCGRDDLDNISQHSFGSSSAFHEITFDSEQDRGDSSDAYFSGTEGNYSSSHHSGDRLLDVLYEDDPDGKNPGARRRRTKQNAMSPLSYSEHRRRELQFPHLGEQDAKLQAIRVLIPGSDALLRIGATGAAGCKDHKSPGDMRMLSSIPLAQSTPHESPRSLGEAKLSVLASWNADDSLEEQQIDVRGGGGGPTQPVARTLFDADTSDTRDCSSCNSSHSDDNFSDISSATVGSLTARRTKLVKRPSDKPASSKHLVSLEHDHSDVSRKDWPEGEPNPKSLRDKQVAGVPRSSAAAGMFAEDGRVNSPGSRSGDSGNDDESGEGAGHVSAASASWQDRQAYHEGNARVVAAYGQGKDDDEGEDGDEEGEGEDEENLTGQSKKSRGVNKTGRIKGAWHIPICPTSGRDGSETNQGSEVTGKVNIPLISAGKHGQEKLRKRLSQSSPPLSPSGQGEAPPLIISSDAITGLGSNRCVEQDDKVSPNLSQTQYEANVNVLSTESERKKEETSKTGKKALNGKATDAEDIQLCTEDIIGDPQSCGLRTGHNYDRYAEPGEVTGNPAVIAGQFACSEGQAEDERAVVVNAACIGPHEGRGKAAPTEGSDLQEKGGEGSYQRFSNLSAALLPERGDDDGGGGGKLDESLVTVGAGGRSGELRLRSRSTSPTSAPLTPKLTTSADTEEGRLSSSVVSHASEQSESTAVDVKVSEPAGKSSTKSSATDFSTIERYCGESRELADDVTNNARVEVEADVWISPGGDRFKSEFKLTLTAAKERDSNARDGDVNHDSPGLKRSPGSTNSSGCSLTSQGTITDAERGEENEKEKENPVFFHNSSGAESERDSCVIGEARSGMERSRIDPSIVADARAAGEGETPQNMLVRVVATAQNITGRETVQQARHKDQPQQLPLATEFPSQWSRVVFPISGRIDTNDISQSGLQDSQLYKTSDSGGDLDCNSNKCTVDSELTNNKDSCHIALREQEVNHRDQSLNGNIPRHVSSGSIEEQTSGCCPLGQNKGIQFSDNSASARAHTELTADDHLIQQKQVVTEVCHTVVKKIHSTTVEEKNVSTERDVGRLAPSSVSDVNNRARDVTKDTSSKTTIVEDVEDTVTTKTTTTTTTLNVDAVDLNSIKAGQCVDDVSNIRDVTTTSDQYCDRDGGGRNEHSSPAGRIENRGNCLYQPQLQSNTSDRLAPPASHESVNPSTHVTMREVKPNWEVRPDPGVTAWNASSSSPSSPSTFRPGDGEEGMHPYPVKRHGEEKHTSNDSRLDTLQATLAQISGLEEKLGAWSCHRDAAGGTHTHGPSSPATCPFSPSYQDHAEATSVLKQIVRGDTDGFPNFSGPGRFPPGVTVTGCSDDYDTVPEHDLQVHGRASGPTYYSYSIEVREEPTRDTYTPGAQIENGEVRLEREAYDNDYDNAPSVTTALPSRQQHHHHHNHHHHQLQLFKPGQLKASSLWTLQEETESLLEAVSPKPARRALTSLASDDEDNASVNDHDSVIGQSNGGTNIHPSPEVGNSNLSICSVEQDLSDTAIGHKHCVSESSDFDDSDGNYSSISTGESASYRSSSYGREQTPMSDETEVAPSKMEYVTTEKSLTATNFDGVSTFNDFVSGLEESLFLPYTESHTHRGNLKRRREQSDRAHTLDSLTESLRQITSQQPNQAKAEVETFPGFNPFHPVDNDHFHFSHHNQFQPYHHLNGSHNTSVTSMSSSSQFSWATAPQDDGTSETSVRLHNLDLDLSRISSCGSPAPSDLSETSSTYTCTGTAQIKRQPLHVSFGETPTAIAPLSPPTRDCFHAPVHTSTPKTKPVPIIKRLPSSKVQLNEKYIKDSVRQFDNILRDFHKRTDPTEAIEGMQIVESNILADKTSNANVSNYDDLYKAFTNDDAEKMQNNTCIVVEDENMNSYRFKRYLRKSHTKRKKGKKVMRFLSRLSCVSEGVSSADMSPVNKKLKTDNFDQSKYANGVQMFSTHSMPSPSLNTRHHFPSPNLTSSIAFQQHHHQQQQQLEAPLDVPSSPQGSPASSTQSMGSERSRADSAYSSISESLSHGSVSSPRHPLPSSSSVHLRASTTSAGERSFSTDSAYSSSGRTASEADRTLVDSSKDNSEDMLSALSDVFEQLDVCEGEIDKALLDRMRHGHHRVARASRRF